MSTVVACCQLAPELGELTANRELAAAAIEDAVAKGASVIVLPEPRKLMMPWLTSYARTPPGADAAFVKFP